MPARLELAQAIGGFAHLEAERVVGGAQAGLLDQLRERQVVVVDQVGLVHHHREGAAVRVRPVRQVGGRPPQRPADGPIGHGLELPGVTGHPQPLRPAQHHRARRRAAAEAALFVDDDLPGLFVVDVARPVGDQTGAVRARQEHGVPLLGPVRPDPHAGRQAVRQRCVAVDVEVAHLVGRPGVALDLGAQRRLHETEAAPGPALIAHPGQPGRHHAASARAEVDDGLAFARVQHHGGRQHQHRGRGRFDVLDVVDGAVAELVLGQKTDPELGAEAPVEPAAGKIRAVGRAVVDQHLALELGLRRRGRGRGQVVGHDRLHQPAVFVESLGRHEETRFGHGQHADRGRLAVAVGCSAGGTVGATLAGHARATRQRQAEAQQDTSDQEATRGPRLWRRGWIKCRRSKQAGKHGAPFSGWSGQPDAASRAPCRAGP